MPYVQMDDIIVHGGSVLACRQRSGKGVGNATGHQQWHADLTKEQMEELGSRFLRLCIGTAAKASRVRVIDVDGDWDVVEIPPYHLFFFPYDLVHAGMEFEENNEAFHFVAAGPHLGIKLQEDEDFLNRTDDRTFESPPLSK